MKKLCECGCGETVGRAARFRRGHNFRTAEMRTASSERMATRIGRRNPRWKGGVVIVDGRQRVYVAPSQDDSGTRYMTLARRVMEEHLGRSLTRDEAVCHVDGDPQNVAIENLEVVSFVEMATRLNAALGR